MKRLKNSLIKSLSGLFVLVFTSTYIHAQELDKAQVENLVRAKEFVFKAQSVMPMSGGSRQLTTEYEVKFLGDSIVAFLPYFGRSYTATYGNEAGGIDFTSTKYDYKAKARKKGGWEVSLKPQDVKEIQEMDFTISENGSTNLRVTSTNRQPISFYGYIVQRK